MSKKELTEQEKLERKAKSKERRVARKDRNNKAITEIVMLLTDEQFNSLSKEAKQLVAVLQQQYKPASRIEVYEGLTLMQLLEKHPNLSAKKLQAKCEEKGLVIDWAKGVIAKA